MNNGYIEVYRPDHPRCNSNKCVYEHIIKAEEKMKRNLRKGECVHHKNGVKTDNSLDNLMIFKTNSDHIRFHKTGEIEEVEPNLFVSPKKENFCNSCFKKIDKNAKLCKECYLRGLELERAKRPSKEELEELILKYGYVGTGRIFNVSDNAIRKWL